jgi:hypothetical protein
MDHEPDTSQHERRNESKKSSVVSLSHTVVQPNTVMIEHIDTSITFCTMLGSLSDETIADRTVVLKFFINFISILPR